MIEQTNDQETENKTVRMRAFVRMTLRMHLAAKGAHPLVLI